MDSTEFRFPTREERFARLRDADLDVLVVGGGIHGAGVALDLSLRGLSVALFERDDYAAATSSASSRLIHGGLRYLEHHQFSFVREALRERAILRRIAPELVRIEPFYFALRKDDRVHPWMLRAGLWLYGALALPHPWIWPRGLDRTRFPEFVPGADGADLKGLFTYADGATHDAALVFSLIAEATQRGAITLSRVEVVGIDESSERVRATVRDGITGQVREVTARTAVIAAGPFTDRIRASRGPSERLLTTTRGTHVVVPRSRLPLPHGSVIFTSPVDGRVMFLLRWGEATAIGTTDLDADPGLPIRATRAEVRYLLDSANALVRTANLGESDVRTAVAGLRPLLRSDSSSASSRSREERILAEGRVFTIAGGKLTGFRAVASKLGPRLVRQLGRGDTRDVWNDELQVHDRTSASRAALAAFDAGDLATARVAAERAKHTEDLCLATDLLLRRADATYLDVERLRKATAFFTGVLHSRSVEHAEHDPEVFREIDLREAWRSDPPPAPTNHPR